MSTEVKVRRGTAAQNAAFTGVEGEVTYSTDQKRLITHDGVAVGGELQAKLSEVELVANKSNNTALGASATLYPTQNAVKTYVDASVAAAAPPFIDSAALVKGSADATKVLRFEVDGFTAGATRVLTPPNQNFTIAGLEIAQIFTETQTIARQSADNVANGLDLSKRGTVGDANAAVISGVALGVFTFRGWDTATLASGGNLRIVTTEAWTPTAHGSSLLLQTVPIGSTTATTYATLNSVAFTLAVPLDMGTHLINNVVNPVGAQDAATKNYVDTAVTGVTPPFIDSTALVKGSADATKLLRFEVDGFTTATTRVLTPPNQNATIAGLEVAQTFTVVQTFSPAANTSAIVTSGTNTADAPSLNLAQTWNNAGVTFNGVKLNVTNTASGVLSLLLDLQIAAASRFKVSKRGEVTSGPISIGVPDAATSSAIQFTISGSEIAGASTNQFVAIDGTWNTTGSPTAIFLDVLEFTSGAASLLMDLQTNDISQFKVSKAGNVTALGSLTAGNALFNVTGTTGVLKLANGTDPAANPTAATTQWAVGGEWQYRSSAASEGAGQTNRVHNRGQIVLTSGTNYTLTQTLARVDFGTTDPEVTLPTAGTYLVEADVQFFSSALSANDFHVAQLYNSTDATLVGAPGAVTLGAAFYSKIPISALITVTASKTIQIYAENANAARGEVASGYTSIKYIRLY